MKSMESIFEEYTCHANKHINFRLIRNIEDKETDYNKINPEFTHQFYGENEKIFGYKNLKVDINFSAAGLIPFINISYDDKIESTEELAADDFENILFSQLLRIERNIESYKLAILNDNFTCFGKLIDQYKSDAKIYEIYHVFGNELESEDFRIYSNNLQYLLLFFVDGSSIIDITDKSWEYIIVYEKYTDVNQSYKYATIGFMTVFNFFAYPDHIRQRISQIFVFPPFQKQGHGEKLLNNFYNLAQSNNLIKDITVEDPSDPFQTLRDYIDCRNVLSLSEFNIDIVKKGMYKAFLCLLRKKLKISIKQILRVYEILGLKFINKSNFIEGMKYKQSVIKRLTDLFGKTKDFRPIGNNLSLGISDENKSILIEREYERLEQCYSIVIRKLDKFMV